MSSTIAGPWQAVFSSSTSAPSFFPLTGTLDTANWEPVSWQLEVSATLSTDLRAQLAYQFSSDGITWEAGGNIMASFVTVTDGWGYGDSFKAISPAATASKRYLRVGLNVKKNADASLAFARARLVLTGRQG